MAREREEAARARRRVVESGGLEGSEERRNWRKRERAARGWEWRREAEMAEFQVRVVWEGRRGKMERVWDKGLVLEMVEKKTLVLVVSEEEEEWGGGVVATSVIVDSIDKVDEW